MIALVALLVAAVAADFRFASSFVNCVVAHAPLSCSHLYSRKARSDSAQAHPVTLFVKLDAAAAASCPKFLDQVLDSI